MVGFIQGGKRHSKKNNRRFLSSRDMSEAKRMESIANAEVKRGIRKDKHSNVSICTCGAEGCFSFVSKSSLDPIFQDKPTESQIKFYTQQRVKNIK